MLPLRFCLVGVGLILLAFGFLWWVGPLPELESYPRYYFPVALFVTFIFVSLFGAGAVSIFRGLRLASAKESGARPLPRIFPELPLRNVTAWKRRASGPSLIPEMLTAFSFSWICVLMTLWIVFQMFQPRSPMGLRVDWQQVGHISAPQSRHPETLDVFIRYPGIFCLNGEVVKKTELESKMRDELGRRAEWTVYVEADYDTQFADTAFAIDTIQGLGGEVFWITPAMRKEWQQATGWPSPN